MWLHVVCYSGGHSSARVAIEVASRAAPDDKIVLLNHDIPAQSEDADVKRFKTEVANYLKLPVTYASYVDPAMDQFDVCMKHKAFKLGHESVLCTHRLKTEPFLKWLEQNSERPGL